VILHGLFAIGEDDQRNHIVVYIPNMGSDHLYKAGNWLAETTLAQGADLTLAGVDEGHEDFDPTHNIFLEGVQLGDATCCNRVYAVLRLPRPPLPIKSLLRIATSLDAIGGDPSSKGKIQTNNPARLECGTVQVLSYPFQSDSELHLGNHPWEPALDGSFVNLHIMSEPEKNPEQDHVRHSFQMAMGLFDGVDLSLLRPMQPTDLRAEAAEIPDGVNALELQSLIQRQQWLAMLGRGIKERRDLNSIWYAPTPFGGGNPDTCPPGGIGS
jgi:hypothetical protein